MKKMYGFFSYAVSFFKIILGREKKLPRFSITLKDQDGVRELNCSAFMINNITTIAFDNIKYRQDTSMNDGKLELIVVTPLSYFGLLRSMISTLMPRKKSDRIYYAQVKECTIELAEERQVIIDDRAERMEKLDIKINNWQPKIIALT
jgi:diacylglycerol kinase family enzyme